MLCAVGWATTFPVTRRALLDGATPLALNAVRFALSTLALLPLAFRPSLGSLRRSAGWGAALGLFIALGFWLQTYGLARIGSSRSAFLTAFYVLFTPGLEWLSERRRPGTHVLLGAAVAFAGVVVMAGDVLAGGGSLAGDLATLGCAVVFACQMVALSTALRRHPAGQVLFMQIASCALLSIAAAPLVENPRIPLVPTVTYGIAYLALGATVILLALQTYGQRRTTATRAAVLFSSEPLWATLFAWLAGETITRRELGGGALVLAGLVVASLPGRRRAGAGDSPA